MQMLLFALAGFVLVLLAAVLRRTDMYLDFCIAAALPMSLLLLGFLSILTVFVCPVTLDVALRRMDLAVGLDGFALTRWLVRNHLYKFVGPIYASLPLALAAAWALERSRNLMRASVIGAIAALPFYLAIPAVGPQYSFSGFPRGSATPMPAGPFPRNCFPSMHLCWALLIFLNAKSRAWRIVAALYAVLTAVVTVASGEHYVVDIIAAVPFAFAVQCLAQYSRTESRVADVRGQFSE